MTEKLLARVPTPCIGVCSTGIGDVVCRGCKRFAHEVIHWNTYSDSEKQLIDARLDEFLSQVVGNKVQLFDVLLLERQLQALQIRYATHKHPHVWIFQLLRAGASQINDCTAFGFALQSGFAAMPLTDLRDQIDREFFVLSEAYYQRYFHSATLVGANSGVRAQLSTADAH